MRPALLAAAFLISPALIFAAPAAAQAPVGSSPDPAAIADRLAARWVALQRPSGSFPDSIRQQRGWGRYGEAGLGYGLMLSGLRAGRPDWIQAGARAQRFAIAQALDAAGVDRIEAGFPRVSEEDAEAIRLIAAAGLRAEVWGFARAVQADVELLAELGVLARAVKLPSAASYVVDVGPVELRALSQSPLVAAIRPNRVHRVVTR